MNEKKEYLNDLNKEKYLKTIKSNLQLEIDLSFSKNKAIKNCNQFRPDPRWILFFFNRSQNPRGYSLLMNKLKFPIKTKINKYRLLIY